MNLIWTGFDFAVIWNPLQGAGYTNLIRNQSWAYLHQRTASEQVQTLHLGPFRLTCDDLYIYPRYLYFLAAKINSAEALVNTR